MKIPFRTTLASALSLTALVLTACGSSSSAGGTSADQLVIVTASQPASFAADYASTGYEAAEYFVNTSGTLIRNPYVDGTGGMDRHQDVYDFEPELAESYEVSDDGLTYTFKLSTTARSTAGNPLTAEDVVYSMKRKFETPTSVVSFVSAPIFTSPDQVTAVDEHTVTFTVDKPGYGFTLLSLLSNFAVGAIYDSTVLKEHESAEDPYAVEWSSQNFNWGFGAYKVDDFTSGQQMVYSANPDFALGEPEVKRIVQRVIAEPGQRANLLTVGDADIATQLLPSDQKTMVENDTAQVFTVPTNAFMYLPLTTTIAPFDDEAVRKAFALAVPYDQIAEEVYEGRAEPAAGVLDPTAPGYDATGIEQNTYDPAQAKKILADAGITEPVEFTLTVNNTYPDLQAAAVQIQSAAAEAGFEVTIDPVSNAAFQEGLSSKSFQASMGRDYSIVQSPPYVMTLFYAAGSPINWPNWEVPAFYDAVAEGNDAADPLSDEAGVLWNKAERLIEEQVPTIWALKVQPLNAFAKDVEGYTFRTDNVIDYSELSK